MVDNAPYIARLRAHNVHTTSGFPYSLTTMSPATIDSIPSNLNLKLKLSLG